MSPCTLNKPAAAFALMLVPGVGNAALRQAQSTAQRVGVTLGELLLLSTRSPLVPIPDGLEELTETLAHCTKVHQRRATELAARLEEAQIDLLAPLDCNYPKGLRVALASNAPAFLTVLGNPALLHTESVAIVGARKVSERGRQLAAECAIAFACAGIPVVSGGAEGVDMAAHSAVLAAGGHTVVVLPQGILTYRPPPAFSAALAEGRVALVSQFIPDVPWETHAAVTRNATLCGLSRMACVIEPKKTGGSIRTATHALAQGKRVLAYRPHLSADSHGPLDHPEVHELQDEQGEFNAERLLALWQDAPACGGGQGDLFNIAPF